MRKIQRAISLYYQERISKEQASNQLAQLSQQELAEFILDAFNRGWITKFNLGLNEDGKII